MFIYVGRVLCLGGDVWGTRSIVEATAPIPGGIKFYSIKNLACMNVFVGIVLWDISMVHRVDLIGQI